MKILITPDSFKGSLSATEVAKAIKAGILDARGNIDLITQIPFSDGGEGFLDTLANPLQAKIITEETLNPIGESINANFGWIEKNKTGIIELAQASGINLVKNNNPLISDTFGTGLQLKSLLEKNATQVIIGLGGSATNDGGLGLCRALNIRFLKNQNQEILKPYQLSTLHSIDLSNFNSDFLSTKLILACDVRNPLLGNNGSTAVFGPQKGVTPQTFEILETGLKKLSEVIFEKFNIEINTIEGLGAAGGVGALLLCLFETKIESGFDFLSREYALEEKIKNVDLIITGEGSFDEQSLNGKIVGQLIYLCKKHNKEILVVCGKSSLENIPKLTILTLVTNSITTELAMRDPKYFITKNISSYFELKKHEFSSE